MTHKFNAKNKKKLDNEWRRKFFPPDDVLKKMKIKNDDVIADIGCGIGYLTLPAAKMLKNGIVYGLDISNEMLEEIKSKMKELDISNINLVKTDEYDLKLKKDLLTYAYTVNVLHEIDDKPRFINCIKDALKEKGKIAVVEWDKKEMEKGPPVEHRLSRDEVKSILCDTGFKVLEVLNFNDLFFGIIGEKQPEV